MPTSLPSLTRSQPGSGRACLFPALLGLPGLALRCWQRASGRYRQRLDLSELDDRLLHDVGITREDAERECRKPPWR